MSNLFRVLGIAGSLRAASFNRALLRAAMDSGAASDLKITPFDIASIPLYNGDVEDAGDPEPVKALKEAIRGSDGLLIVTPEYNYGLPGVLKNAIDWASRPSSSSVLSGKPLGIMGATIGTGGTIRAQLSLRQTCVFTEMYAMLKPEMLVSKAQEKFDANGKLTDEPTRQYLAKFLAAFHTWIERFPPGK